MTELELQEFKTRVKYAVFHNFKIGKAKEYAEELSEEGGSMTPPPGVKAFSAAHLLAMVEQVEGTFAGSKPAAPKASAPAPKTSPKSEPPKAEKAKPSTEAAKPAPEATKAAPKAEAKAKPAPKAEAKAEAEVRAEAKVEAKAAVTLPE